MILAAADCAEDRGPPPLELEYAWQCQEHPGALPNAGGLRQQPVALMSRMRACFNVWSAMRAYWQADMSTKWTQKHPEQWKVVAAVMELRAKRAGGEG